MIKNMRKYSKTCQKFYFDEEGNFIYPSSTVFITDWEELYNSSICSDFYRLAYNNGMYLMLSYRRVDKGWNGGYNTPYGLEVEVTPHYADALRWLESWNEE